MSDITLLTPRSDFLIDSSVFAPLGILYLSSVLKKHMDVQCLDFGIGHTIDDISSDIVGISFTSPQRTDAFKIAKELKSRGKYLIAGGAHPTYKTQECFDNGFDVVYTGEAENSSFSFFPNITGIVNQGFRAENIDTIPFPDRDALPIKEYKYYINDRLATTIITSRGCPANCLHGDTIIHTTDGDIPIKELAKKEIYPKILTRDPITNELIFAKTSLVTKTRENAPLVRVHFQDNTFIDCTPDHRFMTFINGNQFQSVKETETEAKDLKPGQSVRAVHENHKIDYVENLPYTSDVYCLEVPGYDWFYTNKVLVHNCSFCARLPGKFRMQSAERTIAEINHVRDKYGYDAFMIFDDTFIVSKKRLSKIAEEFRNENLIFRCFGRADVLQNEHICELLKQLNVVEVGIGIESGSETILSRNFKKTTPEINAAALHNLKKNNIRTKAFIIVGLPGETEKTIEETRNWLRKYQPSDVDFSVFQPYPGSQIFNDPERYEVEFSYVDDLSCYKGKPGEYKSSCRTKELTSEQIVKYRDEMENEFKNKEKLK